jgi:beta-aspartyl-peptidase (threonine type)
VGAVAIDARGNVAAATSTGGTKGKLPGRVGDSPLIGCGGYADNRSAAVSATGQGEALMTMVISKQVADLVGSGLSAQEACRTAIALLVERTGGQGGVIAIDNQGRIGFARNTAAMPVAFVTGPGEIFLDQ